MALLVCPKCDDLSEPSRNECGTCGARLAFAPASVRALQEKAWDKAQNAIRSGKLLRGECESRHLGPCHGRIEAHHDDYSQPLDVRWLCRQHHLDLHYGERRQAA